MYPSKKLSEISNFYKKGILPKEGRFYNYVGLENIESHTGRLIDFSETEGLKIKSNKVEFKKGMVLYGKLRPYLNKVLIVEFDGVATTEILPIECSKELLNTYLSYFFRTPSFVALANSNISGARMPRVSPKFLKEEVEIPLPSLPIQSRIVAKLDEAFRNIDSQIELLKGNIEDVENMKKSILESIFKGTESIKIQTLIQKTETWNPENIGNNTFEYIDIASIDNTQYVLTETKSITGIDAPSRAKKLVKENDIIFATTRPNLKNIAIINRTIENLTCSTGFCVLRTKSDLLNFKYLFYYLTSDIVAIKIAPMIHGAGYPAISDKDLLSIDIPLPPLPRQHEIVAHLDAVFDTTRVLRSEYETQIRDLEIMRQSLLEEAFEGRLVTE